MIIPSTAELFRLGGKVFPWIGVISLRTISNSINHQPEWSLNFRGSGIFLVSSKLSRFFYSLPIPGGVFFQAQRRGGVCDSRPLTGPVSSGAYRKTALFHTGWISKGKKLYFFCIWIDISGGVCVIVYNAPECVCLALGGGGALGSGMPRFFFSKFFSLKESGAR